MSSLVILALLSMAAPARAQTVGGFDYAPQYDFSEFWAATDGRFFQVIVAGNPFPQWPMEQVKQRLLPVMQANKPRPALTFTYQSPPEELRPNYRLVLVFDPANDLTAERVCAGQFFLKPPTPGRVLRIRRLLPQRSRAFPDDGLDPGDRSRRSAARPAVRPAFPASVRRPALAPHRRSIRGLPASRSGLREGRHQGDLLGTDVEIWMLFAPFWLLGIFAALGALWHFVHFLIVPAAHAAGHVRYGQRLHPHEMTAEGRHHFKRAQVAIMACVGLLVLGLVVGVLRALWRG